MLIFDGDAASNEQLAGRMLQGKSAIKEVFQAHSPNMIAVVKDPTHASTRLTKPTWKADPYLHETFQTLVAGKHSLTQLIEHSDDLKKTFNEQVQRILDSEVRGEHIRNLQASKHRFSSQQKPSGRGCLFFDALWSTAEIVLTTRSETKKPRDVATQFFEFVCEERCLTWGMLADAGDESMVITRWHDTGSGDLAHMVELLVTYVENLDSLYLQESCLATGYTHHMLKILQRPRVVMLKGAAKVLGGPGAVSADIVRRCISRMANWVKLTMKTIQAEWPDFGLLNAFSILNLNYCSATPVKGANAQHDMWIERLAVGLNVSEVDLRGQLVDYHHAALRWFLRCPENTRVSAEAWKQSMLDLSRQASRDHPSQALSKVVRALNCFRGLTTSTVERICSRSQLQNPINKRDSWSEGRERDDLTVAVGCRPDEVNKIVDLARQIWAEFYGVPRQSGPARSRRWDTGRSKDQAA